MSTTELNSIRVIKTSNNARIILQDNREIDLSAFFTTKSGKKRTLKYLTKLGEELKELMEITDISTHSEFTLNQKQTSRANDAKDYRIYEEIMQNKIMLPLNGCKMVFEPKSPDEKKESMYCVINDDSMGMDHNLKKNYEIFSIRTTTGFNLLGKKVGDEVVYSRGSIQKIGKIERIDTPAKSKWIFKNDIPVTEDFEVEEVTA